MSSRIRQIPGTLLLLLMTPALGLLYLDGPPTGHTGGFGEPTCQACHFGEPLNGPEISVEIRDVPTAFVGDSVYAITIAVERDGLRAGGFSVSSRFLTGGQAGSWSATDGRSVVETGEEGVEFAMHTFDGTAPLSADSTHWTILWSAPLADEPVVFHLAANAANGDDSELGDFIGTDSVTVFPLLE